MLFPSYHTHGFALVCKIFAVHSSVSSVGRHPWIHEVQEQKLVGRLMGRQKENEIRLSQLNINHKLFVYVSGNRKIQWQYVIGRWQIGKW